MQKLFCFLCICFGIISVSCNTSEKRNDNARALGDTTSNQEPDSTNQQSFSSTLHYLILTNYTSPSFDDQLDKILSLKKKKLVFQFVHDKNNQLSLILWAAGKGTKDADPNTQPLIVNDPVEDITGKNVVLGDQELSTQDPKDTAKANPKGDRLEKNNIKRLENINDSSDHYPFLIFKPHIKKFNHLVYDIYVLTPKALSELLSQYEFKNFNKDSTHTITNKAMFSIDKLKFKFEDLESLGIMLNPSPPRNAN